MKLKSALRDFFKDGEYIGGKWYILRGEAKTTQRANILARKYRRKGHIVKVVSLSRGVMAKVRGITKMVTERYYGVYSRQPKKGEREGNSQGYTSLR